MQLCCSSMVPIQYIHCYPNKKWLFMVLFRASLLVLCWPPARQGSHGQLADLLPQSLRDGSESPKVAFEALFGQSEVSDLKLPETSESHPGHFSLAGSSRRPRQVLNILSTIFKVRGGRLRRHLQYLSTGVPPPAELKSVTVIPTTTYCTTSYMHQ